MRRILKYHIPLEPPYMTILDLPRYAKPLHVGEQHGQIYMWVEVAQPSGLRTPEGSTIVDVAAEPAPARNFTIHPTGGQLPDSHLHVGTVLMKDGLVWHVYEVTE